MDFDRKLTKMMFASAVGWREAARILLPGTNREGLFLWPPFYTTLFYAVEQSLKAYLASRGASRAEFKSVGHKLGDLVSSAKIRGLKFENARLVEFVSQLEGKLLELRYLEGEAIELAEPEEALQLVDDFFLTVVHAIGLADLT